MASCQKCGKSKLRKRNDGRYTCRHCGPKPITINGRLPKNEWGSCFDSSARILLENELSGESDMTMCHGIGISNYPSQEGKEICHAWIETDHPEHGKIAIDPIWLIAQPVALYREGLKTSLVVEYSQKEFIDMWKKSNFPGPWDERIMALCNDKTEAA